MQTIKTAHHFSRIRDYVFYVKTNQDASVFNHASEVVAAAKRRHSAKGPPSARHGDDDPANPTELLPPPPDAPEGASEEAV